MGLFNRKLFLPDYKKKKPFAVCKINSGSTERIFFFMFVVHLFVLSFPYQIKIHPWVFGKLNSLKFPSKVYIWIQLRCLQAKKLWSTSFDDCLRKQKSWWRGFWTECLNNTWQIKGYWRKGWNGREKRFSINFFHFIIKRPLRLWNYSFSSR